jgi:peptide/nickel transport system substrate-binding protein
MFKNRLLLVLSLILIASMALASCQPQTVEVIKTVEVEKKVVETQEVEVVKTVEVEKEVEKIVEVTAEPEVRNGAWVDNLVFTAITNFDEGVKQLQAGAIDLYANARVNPEAFKIVKDDPSLAYSFSYGLYHAIQMNPVDFTDETKLNPFQSQKIREAMNWLVDRNYIAGEIYAGSATPKYTALGTAFSDYANHLEFTRAIETKYAYDFDKAKAVFDAEMPALGAEFVDGKWTYAGEPIVLIYLIRPESALRQAQGDYICNQLEALGFTMDRQYKVSRDASAIWAASDPYEGLWNLYTGAWSATRITRDQGWVFDSFYTTRAGPYPLYQAYTPSPEFDAVAEKLDYSQFADLDERYQLMGQALNMSLESSQTVFLIDEKAFTPRSANVEVATDLAASVTGNQQWPFTLRFKDHVGGTMRIALENLLTDPWNPVAGSNWVFDMMPIRATQDRPLMSDPYTGLNWPQRAEKADVVTTEGLSVFKTQDYLTLSFKPSIEVPADAWYDWDPVNQKFITVGETFTETQVAQSMSTIYYPADMFDTITWHDGSPLSIGDFVYGMILTFDRAKPESAIYDESAVPGFEGFMSTFKGVRIVSENPLVIETYFEGYYLDAEDMVYTWWPNYDQGPGAWHNVTLGAMAEEDKLGTFSRAKAVVLKDENELVEWLSYVAGPSLDILKGELISATAETYIPYLPTMGEYVTTEEAAARWANLGEFYKLQGHFWLGTGPFYINKAFPVEGSITLSRYEAYPDPADKWNRFGEAAIAEVELDGAGQVKIGSEAKYDVFVTFKGEPYKADDIKSVKFLVFDSTGGLVGTGDAEVVSDGQYSVTLSAELTGKLVEGAGKLEVAVSSKLVALPGLASLEFVAAK